MGLPLPYPSLRRLQRSIVKRRASNLAAIEHGLSNGRVESVNSKIRLITRIAFGFRSPEALIALYVEPAATDPTPRPELSHGHGASGEPNQCSRAQPKDT